MRSFRNLLAAGAIAVSSLVATSQAFAADIVDTAVAAGSFKTLVAAVQAAGLVDTLKGAGPFTVFAPNDEAFAKLPAGTVEDLLKPENKDKLVKILTCHVVAAKALAADISKMAMDDGGVDVRIILNDRRPPDQLGDEDLVRRIDVYRNVVEDGRYDVQQRMFWRQQMDEDRSFLRQRMIAERRQREARLRSGAMQFDFNVEGRYDPRRAVPDDVFAAEADDSEIADVLSAPPRRDIQRRYSLDDIENSPAARNAVARIEIDTVHFGFGEGFLREEEIDKLDRIATVLEKILSRHPDEVFLIEGHTDAVGSDQANLILSRQRAAAVKQALVTYYVIPPGNLKTVGLGERYLKIPTDQPEAENRRVSLARITPLVGQAGD